MRASTLVSRWISAALTGTAGRFVGATGSGAPSTGSYLVGDFITDAKGFVWVCTSAGTPGSWERAGRNGFYYIREYGAVTDGSTDDTAAFTAVMTAIQAKATPGLKFQNGSGTFQGGSQANGAGMVLLDAGTSVVTNISMAHRATIAGHGLGSCIFQKAASTGPLVTNRRDGSVHAKYCTLRDLRLHGNSDNQSAANDGVWWNGDVSNTYNDTKDEDYDERHALINVDVLKVKGIGVNMTGAGRNLMLGVTIRNTGAQNVYSFQDNNIVNVDGGWAGTRGIEVGGDDNRLTDCKFWYPGQVTPASGSAYYLTADSGVMAGCSAQDATAQGLLLDGAFGWDIKGFMADSNSKGSAGTYAQIDIFASQNNSISATVRNRYNAGGPGTVALNMAGSTPLQNKVDINPGTGVWGVTTLVKSGSNLSGNEVTFGANAKGWQNIAYAATVTPNPLLGAKHRFASVTGTMTIANPSFKWDGAELLMRIPQDATGHAVTLGSDFDSGITVSSSANAVTLLRCIYSTTSSKWESW